MRRAREGPPTGAWPGTVTWLIWPLPMAWGRLYP
jgi:hypothetical protein